MGRKHFKAEEIIQHLRTVELEEGKGLSLDEASRKVGVTPQTIIRWRKEYGGLRVDQAKRIKGAVKKLKQALPELQFIEAKDEIIISKIKEILYNGFYRKSHEQHVHTLYKIDHAKNKKIEIPPRKGPPKLRPGVNPTLIGAWAIASTPIPDFAETDYFLGLYPEGHINRKKRR